MSVTKMDKGFREMFDTIEYCLPKGLTLPALQLIYTAIDILGWLDGPKKPRKDQGVKYRFVKWAKLYVIKGASYRAIDLYGARCGVLHEGTPNSDLSRSGKAKRISYCWGKANPDVIEAAMRAMKIKSKTAIVDIDDLYRNLLQGFEQFKRDLEASPERKKLVLARVDQAFSQIVLDRGKLPTLTR